MSTNPLFSRCISELCEKKCGKKFWGRRFVWKQTASVTGELCLHHVAPGRCCSVVLLGCLCCCLLFIMIFFTANSCRLWQRRTVGVNGWQKLWQTLRSLSRCHIVRTLRRDTVKLIAAVQFEQKKTSHAQAIVLNSAPAAERKNTLG